MTADTLRRPEAPTLVRYLREYAAFLRGIELDFAQRVAKERARVAEVREEREQWGEDDDDDDDEDDAEEITVGFEDIEILLGNLRGIAGLLDHQAERLSAPDGGGSER